MVTNLHTSPLLGGSLMDPDFSLGVILSADNDHLQPEDVGWNVTVDQYSQDKLHQGIEAGDSVILKIIGN